VPRVSRRDICALLDQLGRHNEGPEGGPDADEARSCGRVAGGTAILGGNNGHFLGSGAGHQGGLHARIRGPLFMSYPVLANVQYRLSPRKMLTHCSSSSQRRSD